MDIALPFYPSNLPAYFANYVFFPFFSFIVKACNFCDKNKRPIEPKMLKEFAHENIVLKSTFKQNLVFIS